MAIASKRIVPTLPIIGNVRIGEKGVSRNGKPIPKKTDHFVLTKPGIAFTLDECATEKAAELYGKNPKRIQVMFPYGDIPSVLHMRRVFYGKTTAGCQCDDGILDEAGNHVGTATRKFTDEGGKIVNAEPYTMPCPGDLCPYAINKSCKFSARLAFLLPEISGAQGVWVYRTTSPQTISQLLGGLRMAANVGGGSFVGLPLWLTVRPKKAEVDGKQVTIYLVSIEIGDELRDAGQALLSATAETRLQQALGIGTPPAETKNLPAPTPEDDEADAAEFAPNAPDFGSDEQPEVSYDD